MLAPFQTGPRLTLGTESGCTESLPVTGDVLPAEETEHLRGETPVQDYISCIEVRDQVIQEQIQVRRDQGCTKAATMGLPWLILV